MSDVTVWVDPLDATMEYTESIIDYNSTFQMANNAIYCFRFT